MELKELLYNVDYKLIKGKLNEDISNIHYDSRSIRPGGLFVCVKGFNANGHNYINDAIKNGAIAILIQDAVANLPDTNIIEVSDSRQALAKIAFNFHNNPQNKLNLVGVTGTNGKTTTSHLIKAILEKAGKKVGLIGTLYAEMGDYKKETNFTTPEAPEIAELLSIALNNSLDYVVMEVSSHALDMYRVEGLEFSSVIFTNLTSEHLDYHQDMESYRDAKLKLFDLLNREDSFSIVNVDDSNASYFLEASCGRAFTYGINENADIKAVEVKTAASGTSFLVEYKDEIIPINLKMLGLFNVYNALAAITYALKLGIKVELIKKALTELAGVPGRFELVDQGQDFLVIIDYAHTPDSLENVLLTARTLTNKRLITVFGCGGDRDKTKRPIMGEIAAKYSDFSIVTSDNPRSEEPQAIIDDIVIGLNKIENSRYAVIIERKEAIKHALYLAKKDDVVIIAGKGHETYQIIGDKTLDFDDRLVAKEFIRELK
ncbi:MAG: UDP-N-acetylmuramoyl-L-alanyl-D-glutamate--2,6-diaminopimelate ligase [Syntrophomonadaceae bacterium]|nr:UDP-N-acetylmuramoyl-L-alanyl-D-glutamate--2,6-diaminopimelate ligase [Syntrophomonadaceae bacterium]